MTEAEEKMIAAAAELADSQRGAVEPPPEIVTVESPDALLASPEVVAQPPTELVVAQPVAPVVAAKRMPLPFDHENADQTWRLAEHLSKSSIVPTHLRGSAANVFVVLMTGREYGISPMTSLNAMHVIEGKVGMSAQMIVGLVIQSGECDFFRCIESTDEIATYRTRRKSWGGSCAGCGRQYPVGQVGCVCVGCETDGIIAPDVRELSFTLEQADAYGLCKPTRNGKPSAYKTKPAVMLRWRASSQLARDVFPDVTLGLYNDDELDEIQTVDVDDGPTGPARGTSALKSALGD